MNKKYLVRLSDAEREACREVVKKLKGTSQKVRRAQILLKADADGPGWNDDRIAEAFSCRVRTIEYLRACPITLANRVGSSRAEGKEDRRGDPHRRGGPTRPSARLDPTRRDAPAFAEYCVARRPRDVSPPPRFLSSAKAGASRLARVMGQALRKRCVTKGFEAALERKPRATPPTPPKLDGAGEAQLIAMRLGKPPAGYGRWTLQLLADELVAREVVDSISHETVRQTLKKRDDQTQHRILGHSAGLRCWARRTPHRLHGRSP